MGYYSDVKVITTKEGWERLDKAVRKAMGITAKNEKKSYWLTDQNHYKLLKKGKYVLAEWKDVKWYDWGTTDVSTFMQELHNLGEDDIPYEFMRVGEDYDDIEHLYQDTYNCPQYDDMPNLGLRREIEVEGV